MKLALLFLPLALAVLVCVAATCGLWYMVYDSVAYSFSPEAQWGHGVSISRMYAFMFLDLSAIPAITLVAVVKLTMELFK